MKIRRKLESKQNQNPLFWAMAAQLKCWNSEFLLCALQIHLDALILHSALLRMKGTKAGLAPS